MGVMNSGYVVWTVFFIFQLFIVDYYITYFIQKSTLIIQVIFSTKYTAQYKK